MATTYHYETMWTARVLIVAAFLLALFAVLASPVLVALGALGFGATVGVVVATVGASMAAANFAGDAGFYFDFTTRRIFRGVAYRKNLTKPDDQGRILYPRFDRLIGNREAWIARVRPLTGQSMADFAKATDAFYTAYNGRSVRFTDYGNGYVLMQVGQAAGSMVRTAIPADMQTPPDDLRAALSEVPVARFVLRNARYGMPAIDTQILVAGVTGAGKSAVIWSLLINLLPFIRSGLVRVSGLDPKRNELSLGRAFFNAGYASSEADMVALLQRKVTEMQARADSMAGKMRKFVPSLAMPLEVIVIDELAYLTSYITDRKQRDIIARLISALLSQGRSSGFLVVAAVQDPRVETVPFRDLFVTRIGMKLPASMIDIILGPGSRELGAACDQIPRGSGAGMAYVVSEQSDVPELVHFDWSDDDTILEAAALLETE